MKRTIIWGATIIVMVAILTIAMSFRWLSAKKPYSETVVEKKDANWRDAKDATADTTANYFWQETYRVTYTRGTWPTIKKDKVFVKRQLYVQTSQ